MLTARRGAGAAAGAARAAPGSLRAPAPLPASRPRAPRGAGAAAAAAARTPGSLRAPAPLPASRPRARQQQRLAPPPRPASAAAGDGAAPNPPASNDKGPLAAVRRFFGLGGADGKKKLDREAIAKLGAGGFLSYGLISNINYGTAIGISWIAFVKKYGVSPLGDQWPTFLAFYAGMWTIQNFARPARIALAISLAPAANRLIDRVGEATGWGRKGAFGLLLAAMAVTMTSVLGLALWAFGGFPPAAAAAAGAVAK